jgi:hypothetical protein
VIEGDLVLRIGLVLGPGQQHHPRPREAGEVVDVAVGLVPEYAAPEPQHLLGAEVVEQLPFDLLAGELRVAVGVEQALFGGEHGPLAVDVDRAALEHDRSPVPIGALDLEDLAGDPVVAVPGEIEAALEPAPGVEDPVDAAPAAFAADHEGRPRVAHPGVVGGELDDPDRGREQRSAVLELGVGDAHRHRLGDGDRLGDGGEGQLRRLRPAAPVVGPLRPGHPAAAVGLELARHPEAVRRGG